MIQIIFLAICIYVLFRMLKKIKTNKTARKDELGKKISNWKHDEGKDTKQEPLYSSRHESTPTSEKTAEEIVTKHEKIARETIKSEESE